MALQKSVTKIVFGKQLTFDQAYHRIESLEREGDNVTVKLMSYNDASMTYRIGSSLHTYKLMNGDVNSIEKGYDYIKTSPAFEYAIDI